MNSNSYYTKPPMRTIDNNQDRKKSDNFFRKIKITKNQLGFATISIAALCYLMFRDPMFFFTFTAVTASITAVTQAFNRGIFQKYFKFKISIWQAISLILALTFVLNAVEISHAMFLGNIETAITTLVASSGTSAATGGGVITAGGNAGTDGVVSAEQVGFVFTLIRILIVAVILIAFMLGLNKYSESQDIKAVFTLPVIIVFSVIGIDIMAGLVLGSA